jgi:hypothetical protein
MSGVKPAAGQSYQDFLSLWKRADPAKEKTAYGDFLTLWKDADPDIPILQQAKAEYAKLESPRSRQRFWGITGYPYLIL